MALSPLPLFFHRKSSLSLCLSFFLNIYFSIYSVELFTASDMEIYLPDWEIRGTICDYDDDNDDNYQKIDPFSLSLFLSIFTLAFSLSLFFSFHSPSTTTLFSIPSPAPFSSFLLHQRLVSVFISFLFFLIYLHRYGTLNDESSQPQRLSH